MQDSPIEQCNISSEDVSFPWRRFWTPAGTKVQLLDDGYLWEPKADRWNVINKELRTLDELAKVPCLILLGEPGLGKTHELKLAAEQIRSSTTNVWELDLPACEDSQDIKDIFAEASQAIGTTSQGVPIYIFVDGVDEDGLRTTKFTTLLTRFISRYPAREKDIKVRLTCRTRQWTTAWERSLRSIWPSDDEVLRYELTPLTRRDVKAAAVAYQLDADLFDQAITEKLLVPFARKPVTLLLLLKIFAAHQIFPQGQIKLYEQGCRELCIETPGEKRKKYLASLGTKLTPDQKLGLAARLAYVSIFSGRYTIQLDELGSKYRSEPAVIKINDLHGEYETDGTSPFEVKPQHVVETITETNLFDAVSDVDFSWSQQTYPEFLSARYLADHRISIDKIMNLLLQNDKVIPQLVEVAGWLGAMRNDVFEHLLVNDPDFLFDDDKEISTTTNAERLFDLLIDACKKGKINKRFGRPQLRRFACKGLEKKIKPLLSQRNELPATRLLALDIADSCELKAVQAEIAKLALDDSMDIQVRKLAAYVVQDICDSNTKKKLKRLTKITSTTDPEGEVLGYSLLAVWPEHISSSELFSRLNEPFDGIAGGFARFLSELPETLQDEHLVDALDWVHRQYQIADVPLNFKRLAEQILLKALKQYELPGVIDRISNIALTRLSRHEAPVQTFYEKEYDAIINAGVELRHSLIRELVRKQPFDEQSAGYAFWLLDVKMTTAEDVPFLAELLNESGDDRQRSLILDLIRLLYHPLLDSHYDVYRASPDVQNVVHLFIDLSSDLATQLRQQHEHRETLQRSRTPPPANARIRQSLETKLLEAETGDLSNWWHIPYILLFDERGNMQCAETEVDLTGTPGWQQSDDLTKQRILSTGSAYLDFFQPGHQDGDAIDRRSLAAYKMAYLHFICQSLSDEHAAKLAQIATKYPAGSQFRDSAEYINLLSALARHAAPKIIRDLMQVVDEDNAANHTLSVSKSIDALWCSELQKQVMIRLNDSTLKEEVFHALLDIALKNRSTEAIKLARCLVASCRTSRGKRRKRSLIAAQLLAKHDADKSWPTIWRGINPHSKFASELISVLSRDNWINNTLAIKLPARPLARLYLWLFQHYPPSTQKRSGVVELMGPEQWVSMWRDACLTTLANRGTQDSVQSLKWLHNKLPKQSWLKNVLSEAELAMRRNMWIAYNAPDLLSVVRNRYRTVIRDGRQLLSALIASLERLNQVLQGPTPAAVDLWNECYEHDYSPKVEHRLSDYIKRHLKSDLWQTGIVAAREPEIRPRAEASKARRGVSKVKSQGEQQGQLLDIFIEIPILDNLLQQSTDSLSAIIEVKCCFNRGLHEDMERQLFARYLKMNKFANGLYVVGCYHCNHLKPPQSTVNKHTLEELKETLAKQAELLTVTEFTVKSFVLDLSLR